MFTEGLEGFGIPQYSRFVMSRAVRAGTARLGVAMGSGDVGSIWGDFSQEPANALRAGLSGQAYWTSDTVR